MEHVFLTSDPIMTLIILFITVSLILMGRKFELPYLSLTIVAYSLGFLVYHTVCLNENVLSDNSVLYFSCAIDLLMLFLGFITYLWVDNIVAKKKDLKSYGDPLSWFWDKL